MENKKFKMVDEEFICEVCHQKIKPLKYTARDHCPFCLSSMHVDINPGDRACNCHGILKPLEIEKGPKDTLKIVYKCTKCGILKRNKAANDDNYDLILQIMSNPDKIKR